MTRLNQIFAANLVKLREKHKLTQRELAERIGVVPAYVSLLESGSRAPSFDVMEALATVFKISADKLIKESV